MEAAGNGAVTVGGEQQLLISGVGGDQPLVMSAEDAAQFLAQAGLQLADVTDSGEQIIINSESLQNAAGLVKVWIYFTSFLKVYFCVIKAEFLFLTGMIGSGKFESLI